MALSRLALPIDAALPLPPAARDLLTRAQPRIDDYYRAGIGGPLPAFVPSDYGVVARALLALRQVHDGGRFCEWGSGFGVVAGLAAVFGYDACGIEIDAGLAAAARELLRDCGLRVPIACGSYLPEEFTAAERLVDLESRTVIGRASAYGELQLDVDDFDVVFAYPWPGEERLHRVLFERHADDHAVLLLWTRSDGVRAYRRRRSGPER